MNRRTLACAVGALAWSMLEAGSAPGQPQSVHERPLQETAESPTATPLRELSTVPALEGFYAFVQPTHCDQGGNVYLIQQPHVSIREAEAAAKARRALPLIPRKVLRITTDPKDRLMVDPATSPQHSTASEIRTLRMAVGPDGTLYLLVAATWKEDGTDAGGERRRTSILSFDKQGKFRSEVAFDSGEILVRQFEVFGSGDFLLVGNPPRGDFNRERLAILKASGGVLQDVPGWSDYPAGLASGESSRSGVVQGNVMVRGGDGRIYVAEHDPRQPDVVLVHAIEPSGVSAEFIRLGSTPRNRQLEGLKASRDSIAALYYETAPDDEKGGRWFIAVFDSLEGAERRSLYGPVKTSPSCYLREGSEDRFTFLIEGKLVTMAPS